MKEEKIKGKVFWIWNIPLFLLILLLTFFLKKELKKSTLLEVGIFTGSNWDTENIVSYEVLDELIARFEEAHPGVTVHYYSGIKKEDYSEWFSRKLLKGEEPDVFMILGTDFNKFTTLGIVKNLEELMRYDASFDEDKYFSTALAAGQYEDVQYALPCVIMPRLMFVNKTLLNQENIEMPLQDWSWWKMYDTCRKVTKDTDGDGIIDQFGICNYDWKDALASNGAVLFEKKGTECYINNSNMIESLKFIRKLNQLTEGFKIRQEDFDNGHVAFMPMTFAEYRTYKTYPYKNLWYSNFQWECLPMPAGPFGNNCSMVDSLLMGISSHTDKEQLAWEFLKLLTYDEETQRRIFQTSSGASALRSVTQSDLIDDIFKESREEENIISGEILAQVIEGGHIERQFQKHDQAIAIANNEINAILEDETITLESSLRRLQRTINDYLKQ